MISLQILTPNEYMHQCNQEKTITIPKTSMVKHIKVVVRKCILFIDLRDTTILHFEHVCPCIYNTVTTDSNKE